MLRDLIRLLCAHRDEPRECLEQLLAWVSSEPSRADLDLDLRLAEQSGALDARLLDLLGAALADLEREDPETVADRVAPDLAALAAEVAALEMPHQAAAARRDEARRLQSAIAAAEAELAALAPRIEQVHHQLTAAAARCRRQQGELEGATDEPIRSISV
jgi:hypothetical protein